MTAAIRQRILGHPLGALMSNHSTGPVCHAVGGAVRDAVLDVVTEDLDLSVADQGESLARYLAEKSGGTHVALGRDRFSSYRVITGDFQADVWDREGGTLTADLERRDLTINSVAWAFDDGSLWDPCGGLVDLDSRVLRATRADCFERDPLRVLRLARFRATLDGFRVDATTALAARDAAIWLEQTAAERIREELHRILSAASIRLAFETLSELGALAVLVPEVSAPSVSSVLLESAERLDACLKRLRTELSEPAWSRQDRRTAAISLLLAVQGAGPSIAAATSLERRGLMTRKTLRAAIRLFADRLPRDEANRRLFILAHGPHWPLAFAVMVATAHPLGPSGAIGIAEKLERTAHENPSLVRGAVPFLDGHAAARILGVAPGPAVGEALRALVRAQVLGLVSSRDEAEDFLRKRKLAKGFEQSS